jgi:hypothetical protein
MASAAWTEVAPRALLLMIPWPVAIALALFGLVPLALLVHRGLPMLLGSVALVYALIVGTIVHVWRCRQQLELDTQSIVRMAAELLLCPP